MEILELILSATYYIVIGVISLLSLFGVYLLTAHGRSRLLSLTVSLIYIVVFLMMFAASHVTLRSIIS